MKTSLKFLVGIGFIAVALAGCAAVFDDQPASGTAATGDPIVLGALLPLSGRGAAYGTPAQKVLQIAAQHINDAGGVNGRPLKFEFADGGCNRESAKAATENLIGAKKVKIILGGICSAETLAAAPFAEKNQVVLLSYGSSNPDITKAGDFVFRNYPSDETQGNTLATYTLSKKYKKVAALIEDQSSTASIYSAFETTFKAGGGEAVVEKFPTDGSDFKTQITKLQEAQADIYFLAVEEPGQVDPILKQLKEAGVKGPFLLNDVAAGASKDYIEGSVGTEPSYDKANPDVAKLQEEYKKQTGTDLPYIYVMSRAYDAVYIIKEALAAVGEDSVKVKDYLYTVKGRHSLAGEFSFDANGDSNYRYALLTLDAASSLTQPAPTPIPAPTPDVAPVPAAPASAAPPPPPPAPEASPAPPAPAP